MKLARRPAQKYLIFVSDIGEYILIQCVYRERRQITKGIKQSSAKLPGRVHTRRFIQVPCSIQYGLVPLY